MNMAIAPTARVVEIVIDGLHCWECAGRLALALETVAGIDRVEMDLPSQTAIVGFDPTELDVRDIVRVVGRAGYDVRDAWIEETAAAR